MDEKDMHEEPLSESVHRARELLLVELVQAQRGRRRERRARRALLSLSLFSCALLAALAWAVTGRAHREASPERPMSPTATASTIEIVTTPDRPLKVEYLTEAELLETLLAEGFDLGLAKTDGEVLVVWR
jgi:hypothetical protein